MYTVKITGSPTQYHHSFRESPPRQDKGLFWSSNLIVIENVSTTGHLYWVKLIQYHVGVLLGQF